MTIESYADAKWKEEGMTSIAFQREVVKKAYKVELSMYDFYALIQYDGEQAYDEEGHKSLLEILEKLGAFDVDFNGHFGAYIFFSLEADDDTNEAWFEIEQQVWDYIAIAHTWQDKENGECA